MTTRMRVALLIAAILYAFWGFSLLFQPEISHWLISEAEYDSATTKLLGAVLAAWMITFVMAARHPAKEIVRAAAVAMLIIGMMSIYLIFGTEIMPARITNIVSLFVNLGVCGYLLLSQLSIYIADHAHTASPAAPRKRVAAKKKSPPK